ncbi:hypothetical protein YC2023_075031 [Brassica napus]
MKRGFLGSLKKEPAGSSKIRKSTREVSIDTLQATAIDSVNHKSIDIKTTPSIDTTCEKVEKVDDLRMAKRDEHHGSGELSTGDPTSASIDNWTQESTNISSSFLPPNVDKEITMEDFLDLEEFLELGDGEKLEDWDINKEITMEDFSEL